MAQQADTIRPNPRLDTFMCIHRRDVDYLLEIALRAWQANFAPKGRLVLVTNDAPYLQACVDRVLPGSDVSISCDEDWLSAEEQALPGWFKQQIIKLRAYEFCGTPQFCNLGADTVLLQPFTRADLIHDDYPILYYSRHRLPDQHWWYERGRVAAVARILHVEPTRARQYVDFINDFFCFDRDTLISLNRRLEALYGENPYPGLLNHLNTTSDANKFGEWTLYSVYVLDDLRRDVEVRNAAGGYLAQVHSRRALPFFRFDSKVVHLVAKDFDPADVRARIQRHLPALAAVV